MSANNTKEVSAWMVQLALPMPECQAPPLLLVAAERGGLEMRCGCRFCVENMNGGNDVKGGNE